MRKKVFLKFTIIMAAVYVMCTFLYSCNSISLKKYYSQKENYISVTGTISSIQYNDDSTALYLGFSELSPVLDDTCFKIVGENLKISQANEIDAKLKVGEQAVFITAPRYFGDGYVMPIVAISTNGESLLGFDDGYTNYLDWLSE